MKGRPASTVALTIAAVLVLWIGGFVLIVTAALGHCIGPVNFESCDTGAGAEAIILGTLAAMVVGTITAGVWMVRRLRRRDTASS